MEISTWQAILVSALIAMLTALYVRFRNKADVEKRIFCEAFSDVLRQLHEVEITTDALVWDILKSSYAKHEAAYRSYRSTLGPIRRYFLDKKWILYRGPFPEPPQLPEEDDVYRFKEYIGKDRDEERQMREKAIRKIVELTS